MWEGERGGRERVMRSEMEADKREREGRRGRKRVTKVKKRER